jgi:hypothetical protein
MSASPILQRFLVGKIASRLDCFVVGPDCCDGIAQFSDRSFYRNQSEVQSHFVLQSPQDFAVYRRRLRLGFADGDVKPLLHASAAAPSR